MAGIRKGSSDNLTSPIPHLLNADFANAAARLAASQVHYPGRDYYQRDTDTHYRLLALSKCVLADGSTPAAQASTWGTLEAHWVAQSVATASVAALPPATGQARKVIKSDGTTGSYQYQSTNDVVGGVALYDNYALATAAREQAFRQFGQIVKVLRDPTPGLNGTYLVGNDNVTLLLNTSTAAQVIAAFPNYAPSPATWSYPATVQYDATDGLGLQLYQVVNYITTPTSLPIPRNATGVLDPNWTSVSATAIAQAAQLTAAQAAGIKGAANPLTSTNPVITSADFTPLVNRVTSVENIAKPGTGLDSGRIGGANAINSGARSGSVGGNQNTNSGAESGSVGGGGNVNSGPDCASIGGAQNVNSGECCTSQGGLRNNNKGKYSASISGQDNTNAGDYGTMDNCRACNIPRSCTFVRLSQCSGFTPPEGTNFATYIGNQRVFPDTSTPIAVLFAAPTNLAVDASRNVTFTPAANQAITSYEYSFINSAWIPIPAGTMTLPASTGTLAVRLALVGGGLPGAATVLIVPASGGASAPTQTVTANSSTPS